MYLWEIPKTDNVVISFDIKEKRFDFNTALIPAKAKEENSIYAEPVIISGKTLRIDARCKNMTIRYLNRRSGRTHVWEGVSVIYEKPPKDMYIITSAKDSVQVNRRRAVRISVNKKSECKVSLLDGNYSCTINDISVTGIGINIDVSLANKNLYHRTISTFFKDQNLKKRFDIQARCLHCTPIDARIVRCGCEIISVEPPINEYINAKQLHKLAKSALHEETDAENTADFYETEILAADEFNDSADAAPTAYASENAPAPEKNLFTPVTETEETKEAEEPEEAEELSWTSKPDSELIIGEGEICPVCESGILRRSEGYFICISCGSMLD